jgi:hypothetical protein
LGSCHFFLPSGEDDTEVCPCSCVGGFSSFIFASLFLVKIGEIGAS